MPIDFRLRDVLAPVAIRRLSRTMARLERADPDEQRAHQAARLRAVLTQAADRAPFWRERFRAADFDPRAVRAPEDLRALPVLTQDEVRAAGPRLHAPGVRGRPEATSGTTGRPLAFRHDRRARVLEFCYYRRVWGWAGYRLGAPFLELGGHHFLAPGRDPERLVQWQPALRRLMVNTNRLSPARTAEVRAAVARHRPRFLKGMPTALEHLARCLDGDGRGSLVLRALFSGGEVVTPRARATVERAFGARLHDSYGHMERTVAAAQCEAGRYHVHVAYGCLELRDPRPGPGGATVGDVTGTGLHNRATPLVRYDVGDVAEVGDGAPCPCGRTLPTIGPIQGRRVDVVRTPDGRVLSALSTAFGGAPGVRALQAVQRAPDLVELRVVPGAGWREDDRRALRRRCERALGPGMRLELQELAEVDLLRGANGKLRPVVGLPPA